MLRGIESATVIPLAGTGSFDPDGPAAHSIAGLSWLMFGLGVAAYLVFALLLGRALFRRRRTEPDASGVTPGSSHPWIIWPGVVMSVAVLAVVFTATVVVIPRASPVAARNELVIEVVGHQWWWDVRYPEQGIVIRNELHLPTGRPVTLRLTSADVIHSFWVPELGAKMDLLPERTNNLAVQADDVDEYRTLCVEFCGLHHADMILNVVAEPPTRFASWVAREQASPVEAG